ncbi:lasso peptide biosynthesis B2 protein [Sphingomonas oryzagri]
MCHLISQHQSFCMIGDRAIFLDLERDRYSQLGTKSSAILSELAHRHRVSAHDLEFLQDRSLLPKAKSGSTWIETVDGSPPEASSFDEYARPGANMSMMALRQLALTSYTLKRGGILRAVDSIRQTKSSRHAQPSGETDAICAKFNSLMRLVGVEGRCLLHSLALARWLLRSGCDATLYIGVTTRPFAAHCWVQSDRTVLSDRLERIAPYTPILIV